MTLVHHYGIEVARSHVRVYYSSGTGDETNQLMHDAQSPRELGDSLAGRGHVRDKTASAGMQAGAARG